MNKTTKLATDKQIKYLNSLASKIGKARIKMPEAFSKVSDIEYIDWEEERKAGMTVADASIKIDAYHSVLRGMNTILYLSNRNQV